MSKIPPPVNRDDVASAEAADKEQYSLDEMMRALRDKEREKEEKGEVVTRSDGSVARKVKRRRRRSDQAEKPTPEKERKSIMMKVAIVCSLLLLTVLGLVFLLLSYNSKGHRAEMETAAADWTGAEVEFNGVRFLPGSSSMKDASFNWGANSYLKQLELKKINGDHNLLSFFGRRPGGLEIGGRVGTLVTQVPKGGELAGQDLKAEDFPFDFGRYYCDALDVTFGSGNSIGFKGTSVSLRHIPGEGFRSSLDQGMFQIAGWKDFPVNNGLLYFREGQIEVINLSLDQPEDERSGLSTTLDLSGSIPLKEGEKGELNLSTENFPAPVLFGKKLAKFFDGSIRKADGSVSMTMGRSSIDEIAIPFDAHYLRVSRFPFIAALRELFPNEGWDNLDFSTVAEGTLRVRPEGVALERLQMSQKDILILEGGVLITKEGRLAGSLKLSINWALVERDPRLKKLRGLRRDESLAYAIVEFRVSGTTSLPEDSFRKVLGISMSPTTPSKTEDGIDEDLWEKATGSE